MKIKFCGAAGTVTGSSYLLTLDDGTKILLDCGLYQGHEEEFENYNLKWSFNPAEIDLMILSHAHIDHSGRIPKLVRDGFDGEIYCTSATRDLCAIMLQDSAIIQERDAEYKKERLARKGHKSDHIEPLYVLEDAIRSMGHFVSSGYNRWIKIRNGISVIFKDSGHILGSASVTLKIDREGQEPMMFGFTGDIGRPNRPILKDPQTMPDVDYLICESTYGGVKHDLASSDLENLLRVIRDTCINRRGNLIIPAFSVGRTQEIVYMLDQLENEGKLPHIKVFVDSPMAVNATDIFMMHPECFDDQVNRYMASDPNPFGFNGLSYVRDVEASKAINDYNDPCIIVSASGMMNAGRVKHHLRNNLSDPDCTVLVVGYCASGTLGAHLRNGEKTVFIFGKEIEVRARIEIMDSFSAHGDEGEMIDFLEPLDKKKLKQIFLVHGETEKRQLFKEALERSGHRHIILPSLKESFDLG